ncbi:peptidyl-prolyl cis-trans isomerase [Metabacillus litoralis]|uniref:Peptidyl-prolyl cis-trans isomerase n=1 Tax=Metabacillus litoralis TaxID=152268 RepID=A0A5C6W2J6_9BACI|nr:peptidyl-prolyl cis-trans isomerase [Metabacillus litoralis]TXC92093.1 peptidyl-prolyl cis-trans isomerase [Metabacillus litoralis]
MEKIIMITGKVNYQITLDPGVWIFDDRKVDLTSYFEQERETKDELEEYTKAVSKHWEREIREGAIHPPTLKTERTYEKQRILNGTFGIPLKPFLENAGIKADAKEVQFITSDNEFFSLSVEDALDVVVGFSNKGKPLTEDGPIHVYYGDGSNVKNPIKNIQKIVIN